MQHIEPGQSGSHVFEARERDVRPGWLLSANSRLAFTVSIVEPLRDDGIEVPSTDGFEAGELRNPLQRFVMSVGSVLRRRRDAPWFALIGGVVAPGTDLSNAVVRSDDFFVIGSGRSAADPVVVRKDGEFVCFLNDARARRFYDNNHGRVEIALTVLG